jgi:hypothetical protein
MLSSSDTLSCNIIHMLKFKCKVLNLVKQYIILESIQI